MGRDRLPCSAMSICTNSCSTCSAVTVLSFATELAELEGVADADVRCDKNKQPSTYNKESVVYKSAFLKWS